MNIPQKEMLKKIKEEAIARRLIHQSDFVALIDHWSYNNVTSGDDYDPSANFIIVKSNYANTVVRIDKYISKT